MGKVKVKSRCGRQELGGEWAECKRRGSFCSRTLPLLLILACGVGAICGFCGVETWRTGWTAFAAGVVMVAVLRRGSRRELRRVEEKARLLEAEVREETKAEFQSFLHPDFDKDFLQLLGTLDESSLWRSLEARTGWKTGGHDYATKLENVAAEARAVAARLNAAASQAHAFAEKLALPGFGQDEDELSLRAVATGVSALGTDGMSTRSNVLFEDPECKSEDELSFESGLTVETSLPKPEDCLLTISCRVEGVAPARPDEVSSQTSLGAGDEVFDGDTTTVTIGEDIVYRGADSMNVLGDIVRLEDDPVPSNKSAHDMQPVVQQQDLTEHVGDVIGIGEAEEEAAEELVDGADSCLETEDICPECEDGWQGGSEVTADLFEDIASEEATLSTRIMGSEAQDSVSGKASPVESAASKQCSDKEVDAMAPRLPGATGTGSTSSYRTTWTDISFGQAEDGASLEASPDERFPSRTLSFRETSTGHSRITTKSVTSRHRVSKSDGEFLFGDSLEGSASERENVSSVTSSPIGHVSALKPMGSMSMSSRLPEDASPTHTTRKSNKPQGIASRLRGVLRSNRFASSKVVPRRDDIPRQSTSSKKEDTSKANVAPKREDVLKANRIPSAEAVPNVDTGAKALQNAKAISVRRRLIT